MKSIAADFDDLPKPKFINDIKKLIGYAKRAQSKGYTPQRVLAPHLYDDKSKHCWAQWDMAFLGILNANVSNATRSDIELFVAYVRQRAKRLNYIPYLRILNPGMEYAEGDCVEFEFEHDVIGFTLTVTNRRR